MQQRPLRLTVELLDPEADMAWKNACRERGIKDDQVKVAAARKARELIDQDRAEERRKHTDSTFNRLFGCSPELTSDHPSITQGEADTPLSPLFRGYNWVGSSPYTGVRSPSKATSDRIINAMKKRKNNNKSRPSPDEFIMNGHLLKVPPRRPFTLWVHIASALGLPTQSAILDLATFWQPLSVDPFVEVFVMKCPSIGGITCEMARETLEAGQALALCRSGVNRYGKWMNTFELKLPEDYHTLEDLALCLMIRDERLLSNTPRDIGMIAVRLVDIEVIRLPTSSSTSQKESLDLVKRERELLSMDIMGGQTQYFEEFTAKMLFWAVLLGEGEEEEEEEEEGSKYGKLASTLDIMHTETSQRERAFRTNWTAAAAATTEESITPPVEQGMPSSSSSSRGLPFEESSPWLSALRHERDYAREIDRKQQQQHKGDVDKKSIT